MSRPLKIVWSGVHERRKALPILLRSIVGMPDVHVDVLGRGPCTEGWKSLARKLNLMDRITWHGWMSRDEAVKVVAEADIFAITSMHDLTSTVLLEALSAGKPVICPDHCGFSNVVDETCGIKIPIEKADQFLADFAKAITSLKDEPYRLKLAEGAKRKAREYLWSNKEQQLRDIYGVSGKRVVVSAYTCSPYRGSEPGEGWHYLKAICAENEVWAFVESEYKPEIDRWLREHPDQMRSCHFYYLPNNWSKILRRIWPPSYYWYYRNWNRRVYRMAQKLHADIGFDMAHQLNFVTYREPGWLWKLPIPFVWGPVGALGYTNLKLFPLLGFVGSLEFLMRNVINWLHCHLMIRPRLAARKAAAGNRLIAATSENQREMKKLWGVDSHLLCEIGVDEV